jgi:glutamine phosphoribosylpyrophosphate amidotransferase
MCGIMAGNGKLKLETVRSLACQNVTRGKDSAGLGWLKKGEIEIAKVAQHPLVAFNQTLNKPMIQAAKSGTMIGHTRAASHGAVTHNNAHPFLIDDVAFAHNGIISNYEKFGKMEVDSLCLIHGIKKQDFSAYVGSIALLWLQKGLLHAYRRGNPLAKGYMGGAVYLASEAIFLQRVGCKNIKELSEGVIYTFTNGKVRSTKKVPSNHVWDYARPKVEYAHSGFQTQAVFVDENGKPIAEDEPDDEELTIDEYMARLRKQTGEVD